MPADCYCFKSDATKSNTHNLLIFYHEVVHLQLKNILKAKNSHEYPAAVGQLQCLQAVIASNQTPQSLSITIY